MLLNDEDLFLAAKALEKEFGVPVSAKIEENPHIGNAPPPTQGFADGLAVAKDAAVLAMALHQILPRVNQIFEGIDHTQKPPQEVFDEVRKRLQSQYLEPIKENTEKIRLVLKVVLERVMERLGL